jgi:hypothetical protein
MMSSSSTLNTSGRFFFFGRSVKRLMASTICTAEHKSALNNVLSIRSTVMFLTFNRQVAGRLKRNTV